jgi:ribonuclease BN (tRNA processing enzyme)
MRMAAEDALPVRLQFLGSGDAFGSGGRFQTCLHLSGGTTEVLIDCGASSLIAMKRAGVDPGGIDVVLLTHLHGDHFGGLPFLILDGQFARRERRLVVAGPRGVRQRVEAAMETFFPGSTGVTRRFVTEFRELHEGRPDAIEDVLVEPFLVVHASGAPSHALRVTYGGRVVAYSGDTEWTDRLLDAARGADLFVCEAYFRDKQVRYHMDYATLRAHLDQFECGRMLLTHMSAELLGQLDGVDIEAAEDGLVIEL